MKNKYIVHALDAMLFTLNCLFFTIVTNSIWLGLSAALFLTGLQIFVRRSMMNVKVK